MIGRVHHIGIRVRDFDRMVLFYREAFGFEAVGEEVDLSPEPKAASRMVMLRADNCYLEIIGADTDQPASVAHGYVHFSVDVPDIEIAFERLKTLGVSFFRPAPADYGHVKSVSGHDPEGNVIEIQQTVHDWDCESGRLPILSQPPES